MVPGEPKRRSIGEVAASERDGGSSASLRPKLLNLLHEYSRLSILLKAIYTIQNLLATLELSQFQMSTTHSTQHTTK